MANRTLDEDLKIFLGKGPGGDLNYAAHDGYFFKSLAKKHNITEEELDLRLREIRSEIGR